MDSRFFALDGDSLRQARRERALSQQDLMRAAGLTQATVSRLETGKHAARVSTLRKLAETLGIEPRELTKKG